MDEKTSVVIKIFDVCKSRYVEETNRENSIISQANFCLTIIALIITSLIAAYATLLESKFNDIKLATIFLLIVCFVLIISLIFALLSTWRYKRKILPDVQDMIDSMNQMIGDDYKINLSLVDVYDRIIKSLFENNNKKIRTLIISNILLYISIVLIILFVFILVVL